MIHASNNANQVIAQPVQEYPGAQKSALLQLPLQRAQPDNNHTLVAELHMSKYDQPFSNGIIHWLGALLGQQLKQRGGAGAGAGVGGGSFVNPAVGSATTGAIGTGRHARPPRPGVKPLINLTCSSIVDGRLESLTGGKHFDGDFFESDNDPGAWYVCCWLVGCFGADEDRVQLPVCQRGGAPAETIHRRMLVWPLLCLSDARVCLDFGEHHRILPNHYTIGYYVNGDDHIPCRQAVAFVVIYSTCPCLPLRTHLHFSRVFFVCFLTSLLSPSCLQTSAGNFRGQVTTCSGLRWTVRWTQALCLPSHMLLLGQYHHLARWHA